MPVHISLTYNTHLPRNKESQKHLDGILKMGLVWHNSEVQFYNDLFDSRFVPYARKKWRYEASKNNCEHLSEDFFAVSLWAKKQRENMGKSHALAISREDIIGGGGGAITVATQFFDRINRGNIISVNTGKIDGRCYFPSHYVVKIGANYYDPTFGIRYTNPANRIENKVVRLAPPNYTIRMTTDKTMVYRKRGTKKEKDFGDSWQEMTVDNALAGAYSITDNEQQAVRANR